MNMVESVTITGFWGEKTLKVRFHPDINFFVGVNGSGKTTAINIMAAALDADLQNLDRMTFDKIRIVLKGKGSKNRPVIEIEKIQAKKTPLPNIRYKIRDSMEDKEVVYSLDRYEDQM